MEESSGVVIDTGSFNIKAGFSGDSAPRSLFRNVVGKTRNAGISIAMGDRSYRVGESAQKNRGLLNLTYPIQGGVIKDWDDMERVWHYTFFEALKVPPEEHPAATAADGVEGVVVVAAEVPAHAAARAKRAPRLSRGEAE